MQLQQRTESLPSSYIDCNSCIQSRRCLPAVMDRVTAARFGATTRHRQGVSDGHHIFRQGEQLRSLYLVRSGMLKSYVLAPDGAEQIVGFHLPGELLGLDALGDAIHMSSTVTLETTGLCELPHHRLDSFPELYSDLLKRCARELALRHEWSMLIGQKRPIEERLAIFLFDLALRMKQRGFSATRLHLSMSRQDIANFLGVVPETVSRSLSRLEKHGLFEVSKREVRILDMKRLRAKASVYSCGVVADHHQSQANHDPYSRARVPASMTVV